MADLAFAAALDAVAGAVSDREALVRRDRRTTFADLRARTQHLAAGLVDLELIGEYTGDSAADAPWACSQERVALVMYNRVEYLEAMIGCFKARAVPVNVNYRYRTDELRYLFDDADAAVVMYELGFGAAIAEVLGDLRRRPALVHLEDGSGAVALAGSIAYDAVVAAGAESDRPDPTPACRPDDRYILYTGGTTGMPKGVLWRQGDWLVSALGADPEAEEADEALTQLAEAATRRHNLILPAPPFMHGAAHWNAFASLLIGSTVVIQDRPASLDPVDIIETIEREGVTTLLVVGDAFARPLVDELRRRGRTLPSLRHIVTSGAQLSQDTKADLIGLLPSVRIIDILGSSESGRQAVEQSDASGTVSSGHFELSDDAVVLDADCTRILTVDDDELGWLAKEGRVPTGYLGDPEKTAATFPVVAGRRFSVPGDRARLTPQGGIELHGRDSVTINTGGEKVFAEEVEHVVKAHPAVFDAVVAPKSSERWGQEVAAVIQLRPGREATDDELRRHTKAHLAGYKAPRTIVRVDAIVRSPSGKADYRWARAQVDGSSDS